MSSGKIVAGKQKKGLQPIRCCIEETLNLYFEDMNGHEPGDLYQLVISQVEEPILEVTLRQTRGNITKSAKILGINRTTLSKKLKQYNLR